MSTHLENYLEYYVGLKEPGFAVLVTGDWGTGKTYQVTKAIIEGSSHYISLNGMQKPDEVHMAVLAKMNPNIFRAKKLFKGATKAAKDVGGLLSLSGLIPGMANAALQHDIKQDKVLIFDDLERCSIPLKDILGVINQYVEHNGCRVVVIAHDQKMAEEFKKQKEKVFGQTIRVEPQNEDAFIAFLKKIPNGKARKFIEKFQTEIIEVFDLSGIKSLRILRHVMFDLSRIFEALEEKHLNNEDAMVELVRLFTAIDIEVRNGNLTKGDFANREKTEIAYYIKRGAENGETQEKPSFILADEKYSSVKLDSKLLQDDLLIQMLINGQYNNKNIRKSLDNSAHFLIAEETAAWKIFINFDELNDDVVQGAKDRMEHEFKNRAIVATGDLLHIFSLRIMMSENNVIVDSIDQVISDCKQYIDDVLDRGDLPPREADWDWPSSSILRSSGGYTYWSSESTHDRFIEIKNYLIAARETAFEQNAPIVAKEILTALAEDGEKFYQMLCHTNNQVNNYAGVPILHHIAPKDFASVFLKSDKRGWSYISRALHERYGANRLNNELSNEAEWLGQVVTLLTEEANKVSGIVGLRIRRAIPLELRVLATPEPCAP